VNGVLHAEVRKITTTRLWWILLICALVLGAAYAAYPAYQALVAGRANDVLPPFGDAGIVRSVYNGGNTVTRVLAMVLGIAAVAGEYRYQTLASSYLATPRRLRLLLTKTLACVIFGVLYGVASVAAGVIIAVAFISGRAGSSLFLGSAVTWRSLLLHVVSLALWVIIGVGIGSLIKNLVAAMAVGVGFAFVLEPLAAWVCRRQSWDLALNLTPTGASNAMLGNTSPVLFAPVQPFPWAAALLVLAGWCVLPAVIGMLTTARGDVA
jgi:ABC-2 type transport system permease protein